MKNPGLLFSEIKTFQSADKILKDVYLMDVKSNKFYSHTCSVKGETLTQSSK